MITKITGYTVDSMNDIKDYLNKGLNVQFTFNGHSSPGTVFPSKWFVNNNLLSPKHNVLGHYSMINIISRWLLINNDVRYKVVSEIKDWLKFCTNHYNFPGLVMHTDFPIRKEVVLGKKQVMDVYNKGYFKKDVVQKVVDSARYQDLYDQSIASFYRMVYEGELWNNQVRVYLENTTKTGGMNCNSVSKLIEYASKYPYFYGVCIDVEHLYASTGDGYDQIKDYIDQCFDKDVSVIVHMNAIPDKVKSCSGLDRHSNTTLFEDSVHDIKEIEKFLDWLEVHNVDYYREIHKEAFQREQQQLIDHYNDSKGICSSTERIAW